MNYVFDSVPIEIREGHHGHAVRWKEFLYKAAEIRKKSSTRMRKEHIDHLDREARRYLEMIRRESDVERT